MIYFLENQLIISPLFHVPLQGLWDPLKIPDVCEETHLDPYEFIYARYEFDDETQGERGAGYVVLRERLCLSDYLLPHAAVILTAVPAPLPSPQARPPT